MAALKFGDVFELLGWKQIFVFVRIGQRHRNHGRLPIARAFKKSLKGHRTSLSDEKIIEGNL